MFIERNIVMKKPLILMILDGFGIAPKDGNAIKAAKKPNIDKLFSSNPITQIGASGLDVGLPNGQMGNSEVGHTNIGAGRIVYQELTRITKTIEEDKLKDNEAIVNAMDKALENGTALHLMGLLSDGGVHSHITHLYGILELAKKKGLKDVYVHAFLDGRDVPPSSAADYVQQCMDKMEEIGVGKIATVMGRYYAMDRDNRFERVEKAYDAMTKGAGPRFSSAAEALAAAYGRDENDEFVLPSVIGDDDRTVKDGDSMIMFNFRPDRAREITRCFVDDGFTGFDREVRPAISAYVCMTQYDASMPNVTVAFPPEQLENTFGEYVSYLGLKQLRIAETEKYAHVTFFFNGGREKPYEGEDRILVPSPKVATYDLKPEMSAYEVTEKVVDAVESSKYDAIVLNYANADMVGHTGVFDAAVKAIETLDACVPKVVRAVLDAGGQILLTADHGNADVMEDENGNVVTAHSLNEVPLVLISGEAGENPEKWQLKSGGKLADLAPTLLKLMGLDVPKEMTGSPLI